jgi:drug/metabolite transporter (DMT)-like permease
MNVFFWGGLSRYQQLMVMAAIFFAGANVFAKGLTTFSFLQIVFARALVGWGMTFFELRRHRVAVSGHRRGLLVLRGVIGTCGLSLFFFTLHQMPLATATMIQYLSPLFTVVIAALFFREKTHWIQWASLVVCLAGVFLIQGVDTRVTWWAASAGVVAALCSGLSYNLVRKTRETEHPLVVIFYFHTIALLVTGPLSFSTWVMPEGWQWLSLIAVGVLTQFAQVFLTLSYQGGRAGDVSSFIYAGVFVALACGYFIFDESYTIASLLGLGVILLGLMIGSMKTAQKS